MNKFEKLDIALQEQARVSAELKKEIESIKADDVFGENEKLRRLVAELEQIKARLSEQNGHIFAENKRLKNELYEQMFSEKTTLVARSEKHIDAYFSAAAAAEENRLLQLERSVKRDVDDMRMRLQQECVDEGNEIYAKINELNTAVSAEILAARQRKEQIQREMYANKQAGFEQLKNEPLTEAEIVKRSKQNNFESMLGLKLFNKLGIALIIFGVVATKNIIAIFALGIALLALGEKLNRKKPDVFSLGLTAGGVAVLHISTATGFFVLKTITMYPAIVLCVLTTVLAFVLARRYSSQTIAAFALLGGYLPLSSITEDYTLVYFAMGYFILLNIFSLSISCIKRWRTVQFIGFFANLIATPYIISCLLDNTIFMSFIHHDSNWTTQTIAAVSYVFFAFVVYTAVPLISSYHSGKKLLSADNILITLNTFFGSIAMFAVFAAFGVWNRVGIMSIVFCGFYLLAARLLAKIMPEEQSSRTLLNITGLAFAVLFIPLHFDMAYISLGWLAEAVILLTYGILREKKFFKNAGSIVFALCLFMFFTADMLTVSMRYNKYMFITLGTLFILAAMLYKKRVDSNSAAFKYCTVVNLWVFMLCTVYEKIAPIITTDNQTVWNNTVNALAITLSLLFAYVIPRIKIIANSKIRGISVFIYVLSLLALVVANGDIGFGSYKPTATLNIAGTIVVVLTNLLAVFAMRDMLAKLTLNRKMGVEWYPIGISAFFVFLLTQNLVVRLDLALNSVILTVIFAITSLGWVIYGFAKRYQYIRLFGLGLSFISAIKLFIIDLNYLEQQMKIVSYFSLGVALLAISFVYQYFSKRLDRISEGNRPE